MRYFLTLDDITVTAGGTVDAFVMFEIDVVGKAAEGPNWIVAGLFLSTLSYRSP